MLWFRKQLKVAQFPSYMTRIGLWNIPNDVGLPRWPCLFFNHYREISNNNDNYYKNRRSTWYKSLCYNDFLIIDKLELFPLNNFIASCAICSIKWSQIGAIYLTHPTYLIHFRILWGQIWVGRFFQIFFRIRVDTRNTTHTFNTKIFIRIAPSQILHNLSTPLLHMDCCSHT